MDNNMFESICKDIVYKHMLDKYYEIKKEDIFIVWICKILGNNKALVSVEGAYGLYFEITYNGDKDEFYIDVYEKNENSVMRW